MSKNVIQKHVEKFLKKYIKNSFWQKLALFMSFSSYISPDDFSMATFQNNFFQDCHNITQVGPVLEGRTIGSPIFGPFDGLDKIVQSLK